MSDPQTLASPQIITTLPGGASGVTALHKVSETKIRYVALGKAHLKVYTRIVRGVPVMEAFTLLSLAECIGMSPGTMEGRYARSRLYRWKMDIPTGDSRPVRGFPLAMLEQVTMVLTTRGAMVHATANEDGIVAARPSGDARAPLTYERYGREQYITVAGLAEHYGRSITTIRSKLARAGLLRSAANLHSPLQGGRPKRGWPVAMREQLVDAIENGAQFRNEFEDSFNRAVSTSTYRGQPPARLPAGNQEQDVQRVEALMAQVAAEQAHQVQVDPEVQDLASQLEALLAKGKPAVHAAPHASTGVITKGDMPTEPVYGDPAKLQAWWDRYAAAQQVWDRDAVVDAMVKAGLTQDQIGEVIDRAGVQQTQYLASAVSQVEDSAGVQP
jgi:hypothetical protein